MALLAILLALGVAYVLDFRLEQTGHLPLNETLTKTIAGKDLHIPTAWFRDGASEGSGFANEIALQATLELDGVPEPASIDITLLAPSRVRPSSVLLDAVYVHQFTKETVEGPLGLVGKPLQAAEGYAGETIWYDPLSGNPFVAKCLTPIEAGTPARCLRAVVLPSGIGALYAFDETVLTGWKGFDAAMQRLLTVIGAWGV